MSLRDLPPIETVKEPEEYAKMLVESSKSCSKFVKYFIDWDVFDYNKAFLDSMERFIVYRCIEENEFVYCKNGIKKVSELKNDDEILGGKINGVHKFEDDLLEIKFANGCKIKVNKDHPFYTDNGWVNAKNLTLNDKVEFSSSQNFRYGIKSLGNKNIVKLMGYLYSDGSICNGREVRFTNINKDLIDEVINISKKSFEIDINQHMEYPKNWKPVHRIRFISKKKSTIKNSNPLMKFIRDNNLMKKETFGETILGLPREELKEFINGYFNGDGCLIASQGKRNQVRVEFCIGNKRQRAYEFQYMLWRLGIDSLVTLENNKKLSTGTYYEVQVSKHNHVKKILKWLDRRKYPNKFKKAEKMLELSTKHRHDSIYSKIKSIKKCGKGNVIGFEVNPTHEIYSYLGMRTHNTGRQCLEENEFVYCNDKIRQVKDIKNGDMIYGGEVDDINKFEDDLIEIRLWNGTKIKVNSEHGFYTKKGWVDAKDLTINDKIMIVDSKILGEELMNEQKARLFGYLYSDGYYAEKQSVKFVNNNQNFHNEVRSLVNSEFNIDSRMIENNTRQLLVGKHGSTQNNLIDYIRKNNLMDHSLSIILGLNENGLKEFFNGYFNGDGYLYVGRKKGRIQKRVELGFSVGISELRAYEVQYALWRLGIDSIIKKEWMKKSTRLFYRVLISRKDSLEKILSWIDRQKYPDKFDRADKAIKEWNFKNYGKFIEYEDDHKWVKIRSINKIGRGKVIGFSVAPNEEIYSYCGMRTHNCGKSTNAALKAIHFAYFAPLFASNIDTGVANVVIASLSKDQAHLILSKIAEFIHMSPTLTKCITRETKTEISIEWFNKKGKTNFIVRPIGDTGDSLRGFCISKGEFVYCNDGIRMVENIKDGDEILGGKTSHIHEFEDDIYKISFKNGSSLKVNSEHKFYTKNGWISAENLIKNDMVEFKQNNYFKLSDRKIGSLMAKFMGYLFSDGTFGVDYGKHMSFCNSNIEILSDIKNIFNSLYPDMKITESYIPPRNFGVNGVTRYTFVNTKKGCKQNKLKQWVRDNNINKKSLGIFQTLNKRDTIEFIKGFFNGDGSLSITNKIPEIGFAMGVYKNVAYEFQYMLWKLGISSEVMKHKNENCWYVKIRNSYDVSKLIDILDNRKYPEKFNRAISLLSNKKHRLKYDKFVKISKIEYIGRDKVIGFEVNPTHEIYSYLGMRTHNTAHMAILDEAAYIPEVVFDSFLPSTVTTKPFILLTSTPRGKAGAFFSACMESHIIYEHGKPRILHEDKKKYPWTQFHVTTFDNPYAASDPAVLKLIKSTTKAAERQELYGEFLDTGTSLIPYNLLQESLQEVNRVKFDYYDLGVDTSGKGQDETVLITVGVRDGKVYPVDIYTELTTEQPALARKIRELNRVYGYRRIFIDETGMGDTLVDICREMDDTMPIYGVNFKTDKTTIYVNLERLFEERLINLSLLEEYSREKLAEQLSYMSWDYGKFKDQPPKVRTEHPDDYSDSLALATSGQQKVDYFQEIPEEMWFD